MLRASSCRNGIIGCNCRENGLIKVFGGIGMQLLGFVKQKKKLMYAAPLDTVVT